MHVIEYVNQKVAQFVDAILKIFLLNGLNKRQIKC
jgi:hypothetical protein